MIYMIYYVYNIIKLSHVMFGTINLGDTVIL